MISGSLGTNSYTQEEAIEILPVPQPDFSFSIDGQTVTFTNFSTLATSYSWNFGDGNTSSEANPVHTYSQPGAYQVTLNAQNTYCGLAFSQTIFLVSSTEELINSGWKVFPNPFAEQLRVEYAQGAFTASIFNTSGQLIRDGQYFNQAVVPTADLPKGVYILKLEGETVVTTKVVKIQ